MERARWDSHTSRKIDPKTNENTKKNKRFSWFWVAEGIAGGQALAAEKNLIIGFLEMHPGLTSAAPATILGEKKISNKKIINMISGLYKIMPE